MGEGKKAKIKGEEWTQQTLHSRQPRISLHVPGPAIDPRARGKGPRRLPSVLPSTPDPLNISLGAHPSLGPRSPSRPDLPPY